MRRATRPSSSPCAPRCSAGILAFAHGNGGDPNAGTGLELDVIAALVIGGASLSGGQGGVAGTLVGVLILGILENGMGFFDVPIEVVHPDQRHRRAEHGAERVAEAEGGVNLPHSRL